MIMSLKRFIPALDIVDSIYNPYQKEQKSGCGTKRIKINLCKEISYQKTAKQKGMPIIFSALDENL